MSSQIMIGLQFLPLGAEACDDAAAGDVNSANGKAEGAGDFFRRLLFDTGEPESAPGSVFDVAFHACGDEAEEFAAMLEE